MTYVQLRQEVYDRGVDDSLTTATRVGRWVNSAYQEVCGVALWPFLETSATGTPPLTIADVRKVLSVEDTTNAVDLEWTDRIDVLDTDPTVIATGNPSWWYLTAGGGSISVYPPSTSISITAYYVKVPAALSSDGDAHLLPERFEELIVDGALIRAYTNLDNYDLAGALRQEWTTKLNNMRDQLLSFHNDGSFIKITDTYESSY